MPDQPLTRVAQCTLHIANIRFGDGHLLVVKQKAQG